MYVIVTRYWDTASPYIHQGCSNHPKEPKISKGYHFILTCPQNITLARLKYHLTGLTGKLFAADFWLSVQICFTVKDTKKRSTWWCFMAPMRPAKATRNRKTPMPMMPPTTWKLETRPNHFPQAAMPIINMLTICKRTDEKGESSESKDKKNNNTYLTVKTRYWC